MFITDLCSVTEFRSSYVFCSRLIAQSVRVYRRKGYREDDMELKGGWKKEETCQKNKQIDFNK